MNFKMPVAALALLFLSLGGCSKLPYQCLTYQVFGDAENQVIHPFVRYQILTQEGETYKGVTNQYGFTRAVPTRYPDTAGIGFPATLPDADSLPSFKKY